MNSWFIETYYNEKSYDVYTAPAEQGETDTSLHSSLDLRCLYHQCHLFDDDGVC